MITMLLIELKWKYELFAQHTHLVALVSANRAVKIDKHVWIALFEASSIVAMYTKVLTTAIKDSQKSRNYTK